MGSSLVTVSPPTMGNSDEMESSAAASELSISSLLPIVGGETVTSDDPISHTTVALYFAEDKGGALCTGSILDSGHILTAAHCVEGATKGVVIFQMSFDF